jgi:hypothetical protein
MRTAEQLRVCERPAACGARSRFFLETGGIQPGGPSLCTPRAPRPRRAPGSCSRCCARRQLRQVPRPRPYSLAGFVSPQRLQRRSAGAGFGLGPGRGCCPTSSTVRAGGTDIGRWTHLGRPHPSPSSSHVGSRAPSSSLTECLGVGPPGKSEAARLVHFPLAASWSCGELVSLHSRE